MTRPGGPFIRRRLPSFIPIVLIAVLAQFLAPIGAFRAVAGMVSDPLAMASICSAMASSDNNGQPSQLDPAHPDPAHPDQGHPEQGHADCCAVCAAVHNVSFAIDAPEPRLIGASREFRRLVCHQARDVSPAVRWRSTAQARGPPVLA